MARTHAGRSAIGRLAHARATTTATGYGGRPRLLQWRGRGRGGASLGDAASRAGGALRPLAAPFAAVWRRRRARLALLAAVVALPLLWAGWMWFRGSSFVSVAHVSVSGLHGPEAHAIDAALVGAARGMSTLNVDEAALRAAVAPFRIVSAVHASASFPHTLRIAVVEQPPVAALVGGGSRAAVAADGVVLGPALLTPSLPSLQAPSVPPPGRRVSGGALLASLTVLGAAPAALAAQIADVGSGPKGLVVTLQGGLQVYFGDATRPHAKWFSLARVLADPSSAGASYVDVRLPSRPAAGFPGGVAPAVPEASATEGEAATKHEAGPASAVGSLAAGLAGGAGGPRASGEPSTGGAATSRQSGEAGSASPTERGSESGGEAAEERPSEGG
jgi:cell division protein FtsQ